MVIPAYNVAMLDFSCDMVHISTFNVTMLEIFNGDDIQCDNIGIFYVMCDEFQHLM